MQICIRLFQSDISCVHALLVLEISDRLLEKSVTSINFICICCFCFLQMSLNACFSMKHVCYWLVCLCRVFQNKIILAIIILIELAILGIVIWWKFFKK